ncbi:cAMP-dependent protein kinase type, putative, partial [Entamoeba invadens IP1]
MVLVQGENIKGSVFKDLRIIEEIGHGAFSRVYKAESNGVLVASKVLSKVPDCVKNEVQYLQILKHPNIVRFYSAEKTEKGLIINMEYVESNLDSLLFDQQHCPVPLRTTLTTSIKVTLCMDIGKAVQYLQSLRLIHGDLKPENILISHDFKVKLSDFGFTRAPSKFFETIHGTPNYLPPEAFLYNEFNRTCDTYAFSLVIYQIFTQRLIFTNCTTTEELADAVVHGERPTLNSLVPEVYHELLQKMWSGNIDERPNMKKILQTLSLGYLEDIDDLMARNFWSFL